MELHDQTASNPQHVAVIVRIVLSPVLAGCILLVAFAQAWRWGERVLLLKLDAGEE